jgi:prevent-host-death family protein
MSATQVRMHFGDVMRRVVEDGETIVVERAGTPQVAVISLADYERLRESRAGEIKPLNRAALDWLDRWLSTPDTMGTEWWEEFERELREHPIELGEIL